MRFEGNPMDAVRYILGHSDEELARLELQARILEPLTVHVLRGVGLTEGMSVLDVGTGPGDVAMLAAALVGPHGRVVGIDRNADALERARARARAAGQGQIRFDAAEFGSELDLAPFDLVIGRWVLMHQEDPAALLRGAAHHVQKGGALAFIEMGQPQADRFSVPPVASYDEAMDSALAAFLAANSDLDIGSRLVALFAEARLPVPALLAHTPVGDGASIIPEWIARTLHNIGRAPAWSPLADRFRQDAAAVDAQLFGPRSVAGWVRL